MKIYFHKFNAKLLYIFSQFSLHSQSLQVTAKYFCFFFNILFDVEMYKIIKTQDMMAQVNRLML